MSLVYQRVGRFEILRKLGRGGMADVFLAHDTAHGRRVALKLIEIGSDRDAEDTLAAERRGARLQQRLAEIDSCVAGVYEFGESDGFFYVAMEYVEGDDLSVILRRAPMPTERAVEIAIELGAMLARAHALHLVIEGEAYHGVIHGDLKPRNIRLTPDGRVKVVDFGIAKALGLNRRRTRNEFGSVAYSSPERLETGQVDVHSDLWSVGVVLYEMVSGEQPYHEAATGRLEEAIRSRRPPAPLPVSCHTPLAAVIRKALAGDLTARYQTAVDFKADLEAVRDGQSPVAEISGPPPGQEDTTRRTRPSTAALPDQPTERTRPSAGPSAGEAGQGPGATAGKAGVKPAAPAGVRPARVPLVRPWLRQALVLVGILLMANEALVFNASRRLRDNLAFVERDGLDAVWTQYESLWRRSYLAGFGVWTVRAPLRDRLLFHAGRVIDNYRGDRPTVRERDWTDARLLLARAESVSMGDAHVRARLRYTEGHLSRINAEARTGREAERLFAEAVVAFRDAARLDPRWPDPYLGLARVYIYGLEDLERAGESLDQAERAGYRIGNKETAQLADGYRRRADRLWRESAALRGLPQEIETLKKVLEADRRALELYERLLPYGDSARAIGITQRHLEVVEARIAELDGASTWERSGLAVLKEILRRAKPGPDRPPRP
jgi:serine/threonine protein kinase